jgi:hypothetical protein
VDIHPQSELSQDRNTKPSSRMLDVARRALQKLIPSKEEVLDIARSAFKWLILLQTLLPQPFTITSEQEMVESYEAMHQPDVHALYLASWLLAIAITARQQEHNPDRELQKSQWWSNFSRAVSDTVESSILYHMID